MPVGMKRLFLALLLLFAATPAVAVVPALSRIYVGATVIDGTGAPPRADQDIWVMDGSIHAIGPRGSFDKLPYAQRIDVSGRYIIPGLVDSHVHLATPPNRAKAAALLRRNFYGGVTMVRDMADDLRAVNLYWGDGNPDIFSAAVVAGPDFFKDPRIAAVSEGVPVGTAAWAQSIDASTDIPEAIRRARETGATAIKIYADLPPELVTKLTAEAHRQGMMAWAHSAVFPTRPAEGIAAGVDSVSHICYLGYQAGPVAHPAYEDRTPVNESLLKPDDPVMAGLFREMLAKGTLLDATGSLFVREEGPRKANPKAKPLRCTGKAVIALTKQAHRMGVPISTGTDFTLPASAQFPEVHEEMLFLAREVGMKPMDVIRAATLNGAIAAGQQKERGSLEVGKFADFVVLKANPLKDIANIRSVEMVVKRGTPFPRGDYKPVTAEELGKD
jgi:imidazolonepropionase-like amidohydrolase